MEIFKAKDRISAPLLQQWQAIKDTLNIEQTCSLIERLIQNSEIDHINDEINELSEKLDKCMAISRNLSLENMGVAAVGIKLWNLSVSLGRTTEDSDKKDVYTSLKTIGFYLLISGTNKKDEKAVRRALMSSIKASRASLSQNRLGTCLRILEYAADYQTRLSQFTRESSKEAETDFASLTCQYFMERTRVACAQLNDSVADYMYSKATDRSIWILVDSRTKEFAVEVLNTLGQSYLNGKSLDPAIRWYRRGFDIIQESSREASNLDLQFSILHGLASAYIARRTEDDCEKIQVLIDIMLETYPKRLNTHMTRLNFLEAMQNGDSRRAEGEVVTLDAHYWEALTAMVTSLNMNEHNVDCILSRITPVVECNFDHGTKLLDSMLMTRLLGKEFQPILERVLVTRVWYSTRVIQHEVDMSADSLIKILDAVERQLESKISEKTSHSIQILLWKVAESYYNQCKYESAAIWFAIARHCLMSHSGNNDNKIARRLILCFIELHRYGEAKEILSSLRETRMSATTHYLFYKISLLSNDDKDAMNHLRMLCDAPGFTPNILNVCALDAQSIKKQKVTVEILKEILSRLRADQKIPGIRVFGLIRCILRLTIHEIQTSSPPEIVVTICELFEQAIGFNNRLSKNNTQPLEESFNQHELTWFSCNSFNLLVKGCRDWEPPLFLELQRENDLNDKSLILRRLMCLYVSMTATSFEARAEEHITRKANFYHQVQSQVAQFKTEWDLLGDDLSEYNKLDPSLTSKYGVVLIYDLEAAIHFKNWPDVIMIVEVALSRRLSSSTIESVANALSGMSCPTAGLSSTDLVKQSNIQAIFIYSITHVTEFGLPTISRWIRILLDLSLSSRSNAANEIFPLALQTIRDHKDNYPQDEIQLLSSIVWNHAVDLFCASNFTDCHRWCEYALSAAQFIKDGGALESTLQKNYAQIVEQIANQ
ncbi:Sporulation-specific protein 22 [Neolecta irregularis DAH-3]|uniref:Protein ZIP4 homolog n=1 Tax=Neolecta irregularis (strain DAH-3) TaxID=1198029 RepID=A0A1U7LQ50_NEOID|nr:Sporulation-specific protein 22 [Neolecta irregularis DAH-3]|eukprot:OLL24800.1 Sporulation-specific protein 22 [Neolecta irregularis DAH-3]